MNAPTRVSKFGITQKGLVLVLVPVIFELLFILFLYPMLKETQEALEKMDHSKDAILAMYRSQTDASRSFMIVMNEDPANKLAELEKLSSQFTQYEHWGKLNKDVYPELKDVMNEAEVSRLSLQRMVDAKRRSMLSGGNYKFSRELIYLAYLDMTKLSKRTIEIEQKFAETEPAELQNLRNQLIVFVGCLLGASAVISLWLARYFINDISSRLLRIRDNAHRLAAGAELPPPDSGGDELSELERVIYESSLELEEVKERELAILDNAADVICSLDSKLRFAGVNAAVTNDWQYEKDEILGKPLIALLVDENSDEMLTTFRLIADGSGEGEIENILRTRDGDHRNLLWTVRYSRDEDQFFCVVHDVTEIRMMQRLKQQFLSIAGHDMRTPLASVSIILERLLSEKLGPLPEKTRKDLTKTQVVLSRLMELVNELLELEKLESGKLVLANDCISAFDICAMACETLDSMASKARIRIEKPKRDFALLGDERRLVQVIINLLSNAIKFSPPNTTITLDVQRAVLAPEELRSTRRVIKKANLIEIRVSDQGPGIPAEDRALIFAKFRQSRQSSSNPTGVKGTGLGLAIVKAIVEGHGGEVGIESEEGKGSTFWVRIPEFEGSEEDEP